MQRVFVVLLPLMLAGSVSAQSPVYFGDAHLKKLVETELWVTDPTAEDMLDLTFLDASELGIADLRGLEYAVNLRKFSCAHSQISNLSPLSGLRHLEELALNTNQISDLSPLSGLSSLRSLNLHDNDVTDISPLAGLSNLEMLDLHANQIEDASAVSGLSNLETLVLEANRIKDVSPLSGLSSLRMLRLGVNQISDLSPLSGLSNLETLSVHGNDISDVSPVSALGNLKSLVLSGNMISDIAALTSLTSLSYLELTNNPLFSKACSLYIPQIITNNPGIYVQYDSCSGLTIHVDDDAPGDPGPHDAKISDPQENGSREHPFDRVQEAIDIAGNGSTIFVHAGTYRECIDLLGKSVELTGFDPTDSDKPAWPVIDGDGAGPIVTLTRGEGPGCLLAGLVITAGMGRQAGAIRCTAASPTISNCLIVGNRATDSDGAAIYCTDSHAAFINCTIADNYTGSLGAALRLLNSPVTVANSILWGNAPAQILSSETGKPVVQYSAVAGGWPGVGNLSSDPLVAAVGRWVDGDDPAEAVKPDYRNALWVVGDYRLQSRTGRWDPRAAQWLRDTRTSPCIDAGDPATPLGQEPVPNGGIINMGAYGGTAQASKSAH